MKCDIIQSLFKRGKIMNKELLQIMENTRKNYREMHEELVKAYNEAVLEGSSKEAGISFLKYANSVIC